MVFTSYTSGEAMDQDIQVTPLMIMGPPLYSDSPGQQESFIVPFPSGALVWMETIWKVLLSYWEYKHNQKQLNSSPGDRGYRGSPK